MLSQTGLRKAADYIYSYGRDIDIALYDFHFKKAHPSKVINQLTKHVNSDGGFGKGLELDFMYAGSTPLSTSIALDIMRQLRIFSNNHLTTNALEYLSSTKNYKNAWSCINAKVNNHPRAVWWEYTPVMKETYTLNPTAEIIGYFYMFGGGVYRNSVHEMLDECYAYLVHPENDAKMHELICLMRMIRVLTPSLANRFIRFLDSRLKKALCYDLTKYNTYVFTPLDIFESPYDPLYDSYRSHIEENLDYLIDTQNSDGSWNIRWHWGRDEHIFDKQLPAITAHVTLKNIIKLKSFNRISAI